MSGPLESANRGQGIFISYRRSDCQAQANGLHDGLTNRLSDARIFMDIDSIPAGVDFEEHIREAIDGCDVVLVLIGDNWMDTRPGTSTRRIDEPSDFVRLEIENALANPQVRTIPVLVEGAQMPEAAQLPESIQKLARINAFELDDRRWKADLERITLLLEGLKKKQSPPPQQSQPSPQGTPQPPAAAPSFGSVPPQTYSPPPPPQASVVHNTPTPAPQPWQGATPSAPSGQTRARGVDAGWVCAFLPVLCCGLLNFVPLLRSGLIRPQQRWPLIGTGIALETVAIIGFALVGSGPTDADGTPTGAASSVGALLVMVTVVAAVVLGIMFRNPTQDDR